MTSSPHLSPAHLRGLLLLLVVIARGRACVRRRAALAAVREGLRVCVAVCLSVVGLAVRGGGDATGDDSWGEGGGAGGGRAARVR